jgi:RND family efflux transporter MFP subunit
MKRISVLTFAVVLAACSRPKAETSAAKEPASKEAEPLKATVWTQGGELYLEYPALVRGKKERFAIHLTRLADFRAVKAAACEVHLGEETFPCDPSTHPGIFGANVEPKAPGEAELSIVARGRDLNETFQVGPVKIAADEASIQKPEEAKEETITFSKEQQWSLDFGTELAAERVLSDTLRVAAETLPRTGGEAKVTAPASGRLSIARPLTVGTTIEIGTEFASVLPPASPTTDLTSLQLSETEAKVSLEQAQRDRARAERLLAAGAVPARRAEEARSVEATAQARLQAAQSRLTQFEATRSADGKDSGMRRFVIRAPISGVLAEVNAVNGSNVEAGKELIHIVDTSSIFVSGVVPESEFSRLRELSGAEIEMPDGQVRPTGRLVAVGRLVDPETRTVPVTYEVDNRDRRLAINQTVFLRLFLTPMGRSPIVPETAVIDDAGRPVVFVQRGGETFLRRPVKLGIRNHGMVQVLEGVNAGDRVVTKGAYLIRLSTMSSAVPSHGHVH